MERVGKKNAFSKSYDKRTCPRILQKLEKEKDKSRWWQAYPAGNGRYSVMHGEEGFVVSIVEKSMHL